MQWPVVGRDAEIAHVGIAVTDGPGVAILGGAGVGKSTILDEACRLVEAEGNVVVRVRASESAASIPFGAFVDLLPTEPTQDRLAMLHLTLGAIEARIGSGHGLIAIDDAHHLDPLSLAFVLMASQRHNTRLAFTVRSGEALSEDLVSLWTTGGLQRLDLEPLGPQHVSAIVDAVAPGTPPAVATDLARLADGNPLVLRELVATMETQPGSIDSVSPALDSPRLADLIGARLGKLDGSLRAAMDIIAVGHPLPPSLADQAVGREQLRTLEELGFIVTDDSVRPSHPLYGEILSRHLPEARRSGALGTLVSAATMSSAPPDIDPVRLALWQWEGGILHDPEVALIGADLALARHDPDIALSLANSVEGSTRARIIEGRAFSYKQQHEDAERVLASIAADGNLPEDHEDAATLASARAQNLAFGLGRVHDASALLESAIEALSGSQYAVRLRNEHAVVRSAVGDLSGAIEDCRAVVEDPGAGDIDRCTAFVTLSVAQTMSGDVEGTLATGGDAMALAARLSAELPFAFGQIGIMLSIAQIGALQFDAAEAGLRHAIDTAEGVAVPMLQTTLSTVGDLVGSTTSSAKMASASADALSAADPFGLAPMARGLAQSLSAVSGSADRVREVLPPDPPGTPARVAVWTGRGRAWALWAKGDEDGAVQELMATAAVCEAAEHRLWAARAYYDAARLGRPEEVADRLVALAAEARSPLMDAMAAHVIAVVDNAGEELWRVASLFESAGAHLLAAEAFSDASSVFFGTGDTVRSARADVAKGAAIRRCETAMTPGSVSGPNVLTERELDVALDAAEGMSSREIAEERFISPRTVDNHLASVYRKLDVSGRDQLVATSPSARP